MRQIIKSHLVYAVVFLFICNVAFSWFSIEPVTEAAIKSLKVNGILSDAPVINPHDLRIVKVKHYDFSGKTKEGAIMVHGSVAQCVGELFEKLYDKSFCIARVGRVDEVKGSTDSSLHNNSACFNDRVISGSKTKSIHAYGLAIDINPLQNPIVHIDEEKGIANYVPPQGIKYANRLLHRPGKEFRPGMFEEVADIFSECGFNRQGRHWDTPIDYMHSEVPRGNCEVIAAMSQEEGLSKAEEYAKACQRYFNANTRFLYTDILKGKHESVVAFYKADRDSFNTELGKLIR